MCVSRAPFVAWLQGDTFQKAQRAKVPEWMFDGLDVMYLHFFSSFYPRIGELAMKVYPVSLSEVPHNTPKDTLARIFRPKSSRHRSVKWVMFFLQGHETGNGYHASYAYIDMDLSPNRICTERDQPFELTSSPPNNAPGVKVAKSKTNTDYRVGLSTPDRALHLSLRFLFLFRNRKHTYMPTSTCTHVCCAPFSFPGSPQNHNHALPLIEAQHLGYGLQRAWQHHRLRDADVVHQQAPRKLKSWPAETHYRAKGCWRMGGVVGGVVAG